MSAADAVVELDPATGAHVRSFPVAKGPAGLFIKGRRLVAACPASASLDVVDLEANAVVGRVALSGRSPNTLFSSKADNPYVYAMCGKVDNLGDSEVDQVDLSALRVRRQWPAQGWRQSYPLHVAMSADGLRVVVDGRGMVTPSGASLMAVNEEKAEFIDLNYLHDSFGPIVAGPLGRWWVLGRALYTPDLASSLRTFVGSPVAFHPSLDLVASLTDAKGNPWFPDHGFAPLSGGPAKLAFQSLSDAAPRGAVDLGVLGDPTPTQPTVALAFAQGRPVPADPLLKFDAPRGRVVCAWKQQAFVVSLAAAEVAASPVVRLARRLA
jgi:hypothetical protein